jgi:hypothetical protein
MLAHSPRNRSRSPHNTNGTSSIKQSHHSNQDNTSSQIESNSINSKAKKESESQQRMRNLKVS